MRMSRINKIEVSWFLARIRSYQTGTLLSLYAQWFAQPFLCIYPTLKKVRTSLAKVGVLEGN